MLDLAWLFYTRFLCPLVIFCVSRATDHQIWAVYTNELVLYGFIIISLSACDFAFLNICFCWVYLFSNLMHFCCWVRAKSYASICVSTHLRCYRQILLVTAFSVLVACILLSRLFADFCFAASIWFVRCFIFLSLQPTNTLFAFCLWFVSLALSFTGSQTALFAIFSVIYVHTLLWSTSSHCFCRCVSYALASAFASIPWSVWWFHVPIFYLLEMLSSNVIVELR